MSNIEYQQFILDLFRFQHKYNPIYGEFCTNIGFFDVNNVTPDTIPYLPISAFKHHEVKTGLYDAEKIFTSSGTTFMPSCQRYPSLPVQH